MNHHDIRCKDCGAIIDLAIIAAFPAGLPFADDIICVVCTKRRHACLRDLLDTMEREDLAARDV